MMGACREVMLQVCCKIEQKTQPPCMFPLVSLLLDNGQKFVCTFWPSGQGCQRCVYIFKVAFSGRAEIQNGQICKRSDIMNFSCATRNVLVWHVVLAWSNLSFCTKRWTYTQKSDSLYQIDISLSNCTSSWQLFSEMWNIALELKALQFIYFANMDYKVIISEAI